MRRRYKSSSPIRAIRWWGWSPPAREARMGERLKALALPALSLFGATGTLVCCALPALFVSLGAGAALAGLVSSAPWLVGLSRYKAITFGLAGLLLVVAGAAQWRARYAPCPADPAQAQACRRLRRGSAWIYAISLL